MPSFFYTLLQLAIPALILLHLFASPYTKVEESFNIQAIHDILSSGLPIDLQNAWLFFSERYDHFTFSGAVPRTFVGALSLAGALAPLKLIFSEELLTGPQGQMIVRGILGLANAGALLAFNGAVSDAFGTVASYWYLLLQASQFHVLYYASRTLPNSFAFAMTTLALRFYVLASFGPRAKRDRRARVALGLITFAGVVFRSELALLVAMLSAYLLLADLRNLRVAILPAGILAASLGLAATVAVDSFFWQQFPLWPEWVAFRYNTLEGRSADWGVSPWHFYLTSALPKLMMNPLVLLVCIPTALGVRATRRFSIGLLAPLLAFVAVYSVLPHKEWRFIVYVVPGLTGVAAAGASWIWTRRGKTLLYRLLALALVVSVAVSAFASLGLLLISSLNYPGGEALQRLHAIADATGVRGGRVFLDNLTTQTGVTRFLQRSEADSLAPQWAYDKTEDELVLANPAFWERFDWIIAEDPAKYSGDWAVVAQVNAYAGLSFTGGESIFRVLSPSLPAAASYGGLISPLVQTLALLEQSEQLLKTRLTRGRWPGIRMEPRLSILKRQG